MLEIFQNLSFSSKHYYEVIEILQKFSQVRLVGGCVRDSILKRECNDIDIGTNLLPENVQQVFENQRIKVIPTGIKFGTVTVIFKDEKFEITTLRRDIKTNGRHAEVSYTNSFEEDASRRDFTINALSYDLRESRIYDYFNGLTDLKLREVKFIGDPTLRIKEDFLRILRFFRFSSYYGNEIDLNGLEASANLKIGLNFLSQERIKYELDKILLSPKRDYILKVMFEIGILKLIIPYITVPHLQALADAENLCNELKINLTINGIYGILFSETNISIQELINFKFLKTDAKKIEKILNSLKNFDRHQPCYMLNKGWYENEDFKDYMLVWLSKGLLTLNQVKNYLNNLRFFKPIFPLKAWDLQNLNIKENKIGFWLMRTKELWIKSEFTLSSNELLAQIKQGDEC